MGVPFTSQQLLDAFEQFNGAVWPMPLVAYALALLALVLAVRGGRGASAGTALVLAFLWAAAAAFHASAFARVSSLAPAFAAAFVVQAVLFATASVRGWLSFHARPGGLTTAGLSLMLYAAAVYPLVGALAGHAYPRAPAFGVTPCPNTIFTLGLLLLTDRPVPRRLLVVPFLWSLMGIPAALELGMTEDLPLPFAGVLATGLLLGRDRPRVHRRPAARGAGAR
ncbi:DUF6064 family protein [Anaeromyxobacter sp. Red801]|uniref:DUF6064 family protein n=1 Tax=Anaeromyxobacter sp. Red801 TaxID=3411632 RepID=UPI003BA3A8EE